MKIKMTIDECLEFADEWSKGMTYHEGSQGWRVVCMLLAEEVRQLRGAQNTEALPQEWKGVETENGMSCKHGNWEPCEECEADDALYESGVTSGKKEAKDKLFDVETTQFLTDVLTAAGLLYHGKTDKGLAQRISDGQATLREKFHAL